jgi:hypothetical protein
MAVSGTPSIDRHGPQRNKAGTHGQQADVIILLLFQGDEKACKGPDTQQRDSQEMGKRGNIKGFF